MFVKIFTDGAARGNPDGPGGYGTILQYIDSKGVLHEREYSQGYVRTTNNRMELMAAITGLEKLTRPCEVQLYSDSKYLTDAFNQHWIDGWLKKGWKRGKNEPVKKTSAVKTGDTNHVYLYVVTGSISMAVMAEYIHNKNKKSITK